YPELKTSDTVQTRMAQLEGTENRVSVERTRFNDVVQTYNLKVKTFPTSLFAKVFGFSEHAYFQSATGAENAPKVSF
ncbi:MAG: LemA family protein, partial [Candidatus Pacebacteria bacterium]|nr:LemA family protein [Candidatus Paceibacterota bacterium]